MDQSFKYKQLEKLFKEIEVRYISLSDSEFELILDVECANISNGTFEFDFIESNDNIILRNKNLAQKVILRKLNDNIKRIYKDEQANRRIIISQIKTLLAESCPFWVLKTDIRSFYESIERDRILQRLKEDAMLSYHSLYILGKVFNHPIISKISGLPRGLNISSTLSEYYMRRFDRWAKQFPGVYYYARFVDDIIIFTNTQKSVVEIESQLEAKLDELSPGLKKNLHKTKIYNGQNVSKTAPLNYLGYKFYRNVIKINHEKTVREEKVIKKLSYKVQGTNILNEFEEVMSLVSYVAEEEKIKSKLLQVGISDNKVNKIKTRIVKAFVDFTNTSDFNLLEKRIKFLTGNYPIRKSIDNNELRAGIFYNYIEINNYDDLIELDTFYRKILFSKKKSVGLKIKGKLTNSNKIILKKYSFVSGFKMKIYSPFTREEMTQIVNCW